VLEAIKVLAGRTSARRGHRDGKLVASSPSATTPARSSSGAHSESRASEIMTRNVICLESAHQDARLHGAHVGENIRHLPWSTRPRVGMVSIRDIVTTSSPTRTSRSRSSSSTSSASQATPRCRHQEIPARCCKFEPRQVLARWRSLFEAVDLDLASGELVAILGESGAGKSTLLNIIAASTAPMPAPSRCLTPNRCQVTYRCQVPRSRRCRR